MYEQKWGNEKKGKKLSALFDVYLKIVTQVNLLALYPLFNPLLKESSNGNISCNGKLVCYLVNLKTKFYC